MTVGEPPTDPSPAAGSTAALTGPTPPPHRSRPEIEHVPAEALPGFLAQVMRGFHGAFHDDTPELDRRLFLPDRTFGHRVEGRWVSTCGSFVRRLAVPGGALVDVAAVTIVSVSPSYRRRGLLRELMTHQLQQVHERGEPLALLWASESVIYGRFGYGLSIPKAEQSGLTRSLVFHPDVDLGTGSVAEVEADEYARIATGLHLALLPDRPGGLDRSDDWWKTDLLDHERDRHGFSARRHLVGYDADGTPNGYATFRGKLNWTASGPNGELAVEEIDALDPAGYARLWRFLADLDLVRSFTRETAPVDDPLRHLLADPRVLTSTVLDGTHLRLVDVARALEVRTYLSEVDLVLEVTDALLPHNEGRWHLRAGLEGASVRKARRRPDLSLGVKELASLYFGAVSPAALAAAGRIAEHRAGALDRAGLAFYWPRAPFTPDHF